MTRDERLNYCQVLQHNIDAWELVGRMVGAKANPETRDLLKTLATHYGTFNRAMLAKVAAGEKRASDDGREDIAWLKKLYEKE